MGRALRVDAGNFVYHVINRGNFRYALFKTPNEYDNFINILREALAIMPMRLLSYCLMPNHWHLVLYPEHDGDLSCFMQWITLTHTQRYHALTETIGLGHIYQGRYKSFIVKDDFYFLNLIRYVEGNAKRAGIVPMAEDWRWSSAHIRAYGTETQKQFLSAWPVDIPDNYIIWLNQMQVSEDLQAIRHAVQRENPYGPPAWTTEIVEQFGLESTVRNRGRQPKGV